jgi:hypothetical protein
MPPRVHGLGAPLNFTSLFVCFLPFCKIVYVSCSDVIKRKFFLVFNIKFQREASFVLHLKKNFETSAGSAITNGREPRSCFGQVSTLS